MSSELSLFYAVEMSGICQESVICFLPVLSGGVPKSLSEFGFARMPRASERPYSTEEENSSGGLPILGAPLAIFS